MAIQTVIPAIDAIGVYRSAALSSPSLGSYAAISWDAEESAIPKVGFTHSNASNADQLVCDVAGRYLIDAQVTINGAVLALVTVSGLAVRIAINGVVTKTSSINGLSISSGELSHACEQMTSLSAGDVVRIEFAVFGLLTSVAAGSTKTNAQIVRLPG